MARCPKYVRRAIRSGHGIHPQTSAHGFNSPSCIPPSMTRWQPPKREPEKTKAELREMLAEAVRNTQAENKRLQQAQRVKAA
jgi:hypothetical protein